ncbi:MAG: NAD-dependent epimerase/dehydratase family protein [Ignavibacteria bacterium]|jgi:nucleoside-diphosphate-sugar epimerase
MDKKITSVVTGATGFVGSHLVDLLLEKGNRVKCITRKTSSLRWLKDKPVEIYDCGLFDREALKEVIKDADYLFHVAGVVKAKDKEGYYKGNVETTGNLLDVVKEVNPGIKKVVIVSSLTACGPSKIGRPNNEETIPNPITNYGRSKLEQEKLTKKYMNDLPITIVRPPAVYGERDTEIYLYFKTYQQGLMAMIGFNDKEISLIHVKDLVNGIYLAGISDNSAGKLYLITPEEIYTWPQIGDAIEKHIGKKALRIKIPHFLIYTVGAVAEFFSWFSSKAATFNYEKARDFVQEAQTCDASKAVKELGYRQQTSLDEGIKRTIDWYREMKWLK